MSPSGEKRDGCDTPLMPREQADFGTGIRIIKPNSDAIPNCHKLAVRRERNITGYPTFTEPRSGRFGQPPLTRVLGKASLQRQTENEHQVEI